MHIIYNILYFLAAWRWGDWRNWQNYYPTILFLILGDLLHNFLAYDHSLWIFRENLHPSLLTNHTSISLMYMLVSYPATILIYLKYFFKTDKWRKRVFHYVLWVLIYITAEFINLHFGLFTHHNGWEYGYSVLFVMMMFLLFPIHYRKPLLAWGISFLIILLILLNFDLPLYFK
ncbi:CBO0543 family protein [Alkalihalobacillus deserti]|uniref:CBO0543 family protein n=1 Tax=Alkalihalobacillus deserti TaxID=2879466 RepID=UPI001D150869|nr:CBO0543 family protein [Alkalihalobacillus deserti]